MNQDHAAQSWRCERVDWLGRGAYRGVLGKYIPVGWKERGSFLAVGWKGRLILSVFDFGDSHACQMQRRGEGSRFFLVSQNLSPKQARCLLFLLQQGKVVGPGNFH